MLDPSFGSRDADALILQDAPSLSVGWRELVHNYFRLHITLGTSDLDLFPALAGLARHWNASMGERHLSG
jgi:hypothetical protein